jgi:hypothetical protein
LLASVDVMEFQTTDAYSRLDRTSAKYSLSIDYIEEKLKAILRISPKSLVDCEKIIIIRIKLAL